MVISNIKKQVKLNVMKAKKSFIVVAYDISKNKRRIKVSKLLEKFGQRINKSVFECMLTKKELENVKEQILPFIDKKTDTIAFYTVCVDCFTKAEIFPHRRWWLSETIIH